MGVYFWPSTMPGLSFITKFLCTCWRWKALDVGGGLSQRFEEVAVHVRKGVFDLLLRHLEVLQLRAVELEGVFFQGLIAPGADVRKDGVHHVFHVLLRADVAVQNLFGLQRSQSHTA